VSDYILLTYFVMLYNTTGMSHLKGQSVFLQMQIKIMTI